MKALKLVAGLVVAHALVATDVYARDLSRRSSSTSTKGINMSKSTRNTGKHWSSSDVSRLRNLAHQNTPTRVIGLKLGRTEGAVRSKARREAVSLRPTNQSPYNRRK